VRLVKRHSATWLVVLPLTLVGVEAAHALANAAFGSPEDAGEIFASTESGGDLLPTLSALALGALLLGLCGQVAGSWALPRQRGSFAFPFAALPPVAFVLLEGLEGVLHRSSVPSDLLLEPAFLAGLVLQLPFAIAGYLVARVLLRLSDSVRRLIAQRRARRSLAAPRQLKPSQRDGRWATFRRGSAHLGRAPPPALVASG
jgi:hypothetical protein